MESKTAESDLSEIVVSLAMLVNASWNDDDWEGEAFWFQIRRRKGS